MIPPASERGGATKPKWFWRARQRIAFERRDQRKTKSHDPQKLPRLTITLFRRVRAMRAVLLLLLLRHSLALVAPAAKPRATRLSALTDEVLDVAQWVGTTAETLPVGEYAPFAAAGAAAGAMAVSGAAVLRSFERDAPVESPLSSDGRYDPEAADAYFGRRPIQTLRRGAEIAGRAAGLGAAILLDVATDSVKENEKERATAVVDA